MRQTTRKDAVPVLCRFSPAQVKMLEQLVGTLGLSVPEVVRYIVAKHLDERTAWLKR